MQADPFVSIAFTALIGASIGFFGCAIYTSRIVKEAKKRGWAEGVSFYQEREKQASRDRL